MGLGLGAFYGKLLTGEKIIREFLTVGANDGLREKVYLAADGRIWDVTGNQWLLGLDPRVMGIWVAGAGARPGGKEDAGGGVKAEVDTAEDLGGRTKYTLYMRDAERQGGEDPA